jgi:hypothetical protein
VRGYDIAVDAEVYGPDHFFAVPSDIVVTNGILRFRVGERNAITYLAVSVFKAGAWRAKGYLWLSSYKTLSRARMVDLTPERAACVLSTRNEGEVTVELQRGRRSLRIIHGSTRSPSVLCPRVIYWSGLSPPDITAGWGFGGWGSAPWGGVGTGIGEVPGSPLTAGLAYETTVEGGSTRLSDAYGLTRGIAVLRRGAKKAGLGVARTTRSFEVGAFVATATTGDDLVDHHRQLACASEQTVRLS